MIFKILLTAMICWWTLVLPALADPAKLPFPRQAVQWRAPTLESEAVENLAKFDVVIVDMDVLINNQDRLEEIKRLNPGVKLLLYSNPMEVHHKNNLKNRPLQTKLYDYVFKHAPEWFLLRPNGEPVFFYGEMHMLNKSTWCPLVNGKTWLQFLAEFLLAQCLKHPLVDGYYMDNSGANIWWLGTKRGDQGVDADNNGVNDDKEALNQAWEAGIREFLETIRQDCGPDFILIGNKMSLDYMDLFDGKMSEHFPNNYLGSDYAGGWFQTMENYFQAGPYAINQAQRKPHNEEHRLFVLSSTLLGDGFYMYSHNLSRQFPEYRKIGKALGPHEVDSENNVWTREFEGATVRVRPLEQKGEIIYKEEKKEE